MCPVCGGRGLAWAYALGIVGYGAGLVLSALFDLPTGAVIVWTLAALGAGRLLLSRRPGALGDHPEA